MNTPYFFIVFTLYSLLWCGSPQPSTSQCFDVYASLGGFDGVKSDIAFCRPGPNPECCTKASSRTRDAYL
jgi:hypothetical protein